MAHSLHTRTRARTHTTYIHRKRKYNIIFEVLSGISSGCFCPLTFTGRIYFLRFMNIKCYIILPHPFLNILNLCIRRTDMRGCPPHVSFCQKIGLKQKKNGSFN
jgi:hypothetical protein